MDVLKELKPYGKNMKVFLDTNVILDYLLKRKPFYESAKKIFDSCLFLIDGFVTPHSLIDIFYMLTERTDSSLEYCRNTIQKLAIVLTVVPEDEKTVKSASANVSFADFEDSMQNQAACRMGADYIITRNLKDFDNSEVQIISPDEFVLNFLND